MATTFNDLWNELIGELGTDFPPALAQRHVNAAWQEIMNQRPWSFLLAEGVLQCPPSITGTATFTQYSNAVVADATLQAALDTITTQPLLTRRAIRATTADGFPSGQIFQIYAYGDPSSIDPPPGTLVLNRAWQEPSGVRTVIIYRSLFLPPLDENGEESDDFTRFISVKDTVSNYPIVLNRTVQWLDRIDTSRTSTGTPQALVQSPLYYTRFPGASSDGNLAPGTPLYELWPHYTGTDQRTYLCLYLRRGKPLTRDFGTVTSALPYQIDRELVLAGARKRAYRWAEINKGKVSYLAKTNWLQLMQEASDQWQSLYMDMRRLDNEIMQNDVLKRWPEVGLWDQSASFAQTHDIALMGGIYGVGYGGL